ncbi:peptidoglycan-binding protein [Sphingomonadaceae bacterium LXI357]|uniref:Peptidoglycan-binding protein n=2 Tax=Stakelama marina TaxID=2826939 RepID=A0A8T4I976_9SPHN|nr:peptidoglycan-binding protein [Stakelama marina]MBR0550911.1 peptidoglycan-binding protein [Stakelama marina]
MQTIDLGTMNPAARARLIYSQARSEVTDRLWQAAIGGADRGTDRADSWQAAGTPGSLDSMLTSLVARNRAPGSASLSGPESLLPAGYSPVTPTVVAPSPGPVANMAAQSNGAVDAVGGLGVNAGYAPALERAAERSGVPAPSLAAIIDAEAAKRSDGSWNLFSRNPRSSAAGLGQFLSRTWIGMAEREGNWLNDVARDKGWLDSRGNVRSQARGPLLALRYDAEASINTIADYARSNIDHIRNSGIRTPDNPAALAKLAYLGHHLGPGDAVRFLDGGLSDRRAATLLKAQIGAGRAADRIDQAGSAADAHRAWLNNYIASHIRPDRFSDNGATAYA